MGPAVPHIAAFLQRDGPLELQPELLRLLRNISSPGASALGLVLTPEDGVLEAVVGCMTRARRNNGTPAAGLPAVVAEVVVEIQVQGCAAIWNLAITDATRALIIAAGGGEAVQGAMAKFPEHPKVQAVGEAAMRALRLSDPSRLSQSLRA